jgi:formylglycine-generating enzyme required for sulfatase activity
MKAIHYALWFVAALLLATGAYATGTKMFIDCANCPEMVTIPEGSFEMGSNAGNASEMPVHRVTITRAFAMGKTEVTQGQWKALMGNNPSGFGDCGDNCPVENVSWDDAQKFIQKLNAKTGKQYRLPSEAEWEYAARAGNTTAFPWGEQASHEYANYGADECCKGFSLGRDQWVNTSPAGSFPANAFGLYDMIGNVWEWTEDSYHDDYTGAPVDGSAWRDDSANRVLRGGSWYFKPQRTAYRGRNLPTYRYHNFGFRLARTLP